MSATLRPASWFPPELTLPAAARAAGTLTLPGSKSISIRALLLAALAEGETRLTQLLESEDTEVMLAALRALGVEWTRSAPGDYLVRGAGGAFVEKRADLHLGLSGLSLRSLVGALAFSGGDYRVDGVARMRERPITDLVDALRALGADIRYELADGFPPLLLGAATSTERAGDRVSIRGDVSSQFLTGLLQALPLAHREVTVQVQGALISRPYIDITIDLMRRFGVDVVATDGDSFRVTAGKYQSPGALAVEGDASGASYFLAAGVLGQGPVRVVGVGSESVQGDVGFARVLAQQGAAIGFGQDWIEAAAGRRFIGGNIDCERIPDAAMTLAITALKAESPTLLTGIGSWRVKETDRLAAMAVELRKLGATVDEGPDWLRIEPLAQPQAATIATYGDHRIAMCFALVSLLGTAVTIADPACVRKTYPAFFTDFARICK